MDPTVAAAIISASMAVLGPFLLNRWDKLRNKRITNALEAPSAVPASLVNLTKKSGEEQFIDFLKNSLAGVQERLESLETDRDSDAKLIKAQAAELLELRARTADLEKHDRDRDAYIIVLTQWGMNSNEAPPRTPPPWRAS
jgi:hypothetical protein